MLCSLKRFIENRFKYKNFLVVYVRTYGQFLRGVSKEQETIEGTLLEVINKANNRISKEKWYSFHVYVYHRFDIKAFNKNLMVYSSCGNVVDLKPYRSNSERYWDAVYGRYK